MVTDGLSCVGAAAIVTEPTAETLPALSVALNCTVCAALVFATVNGAV